MPLKAGSMAVEVRYSSTKPWVTVEVYQDGRPVGSFDLSAQTLDYKKTEEYFTDGSWGIRLAFQSHDILAPESGRS